ncbi:hypothetical protein LXL04_012144 [Taraxacum kok-saghyz]
MKRNGDRGSPCRTPLEMGNSFVADSFKMTEALAEEMHPHFNHKVNNMSIASTSEVAWKRRSIAGAFPENRRNYRRQLPFAGKLKSNEVTNSKQRNKGNGFRKGIR